MQRRNLYKRDHIRIPQDDTKVETDNFEDLRYHSINERTPEAIPWKTVFLVVFLFIAGTCCLGICLAIAIGYCDPKYNDRVWPAFCLGFIMFIPGAYYMKVIICTLLHVCGNTFDDIPHFNN